MKRLLILLSLTLLAGCAHRVTSGPQDTPLDQAAAISDRIEDKAVVVEQYLEHTR